MPPSGFGPTGIMHWGDTDWLSDNQRAFFQGIEAMNAAVDLSKAGMLEEAVDKCHEGIR